MATPPRIVAELGRPETPEETADRKAASSRAYRSSKTFRSLAGALLATLALVAIVVISGPHGSFDATPQIDVAAVAKQAASSYDTTIVVPTVPKDWRVNRAAVGGDSTPTWTVVYATGSAPGFVNVAQGIGADSAWDARLLSGAGATGSVRIDGITWTEYGIGDPSQTANISYAIGTVAGHDRILIYGSTDAKTAAVAARGLTDQIRALRKDTP